MKMEATAAPKFELLQERRSVSVPVDAPIGRIAVNGRPLPSLSPWQAPTGMMRAGVGNDECTMGGSIEHALGMR